MPLALSPEIKYASVDASADGVQTVVAAVASKRICVLGYALTNATTAGVATIQDNTGTPVVLAKLSFALNGSVNYAGSMNAPAFVTSTGKSLDINNAAGVDVKGHLAYIEVD